MNYQIDIIYHVWLVEKDSKSPDYFTVIGLNPSPVGFTEQVNNGTKEGRMEMWNDSTIVSVGPAILYLCLHHTGSAYSDTTICIFVSVILQVNNVLISHSLLSGSDQPSVHVYQTGLLQYHQGLQTSPYSAFANSGNDDAIAMDMGL